MESYSNTDLQDEDTMLEVKDQSNNERLYKGLLTLKQQLDNLVLEVNAGSTMKVRVVERKTKQVKKNTKTDRVYTLEELYKGFVKKHQITEPITETQLGSYLQYYFDVRTNEMKPLKDDVKKCLNIPDKEFSIIRKAFEEKKINAIPKKEDLKYFMGLLENKKATVEYNNATYNLLDPKGLINNKELFTITCNGDKIKPKTMYTFDVDFCDKLKELGILSHTFDSSKSYTESALVEVFNRYNYNQVQLYQQIDLKNQDLLNLLNIDESNYLVMDFVYIRPKLLKELLSSCCDNNNLLPEYVDKLETYKITNFNTLSNYLKTITYYD